MERRRSGNTADCAAVAAGCSTVHVQLTPMRAPGRSRALIAAAQESAETKAARSLSPPSASSVRGRGGGELAARSSRRSASGSPPPKSGHSALPRRSPDRCHADLYDDAFARQRRLRELKEHLDQVHAQEERQRHEEFEGVLRERRRTYRMKDTRTRMEREEEFLRRRKAKEERVEIVMREREEEELRSCTFRPSLFSAKQQGPQRQQSPRSFLRSDEEVPPAVQIQRLLDRQRKALDAAAALTEEEVKVQTQLRATYAEIHDRTQREETQRIVATLQDTDSKGQTQQELVSRVKRLVEEGHDPGAAQRIVVEELVAKSQREVQQRVQKAFGPARFEAEGDIYARRLAIVHELEAAEAAIISLRSGSFVQDAKAAGFEFGLADKLRPSPPTLRCPSAEALPEQEKDPKTAADVESQSRGATPLVSPMGSETREIVVDVMPGMNLPCSTGSPPHSGGTTPATVTSASQQSSKQLASPSGSVLDDGPQSSGEDDSVHAEHVAEAMATIVDHPTEICGANVDVQAYDDEAAARAASVIDNVDEVSPCASSACILTTSELVPLHEPALSRGDDPGREQEQTHQSEQDPQQQQQQMVNTNGQGVPSLVSSSPPCGSPPVSAPKAGLRSLKDMKPINVNVVQASKDGSSLRPRTASGAAIPIAVSPRSSFRVLTPVVPQAASQARQLPVSPPVVERRIHPIAVPLFGNLPVSSAPTGLTSPRSPRALSAVRPSSYVVVQPLTQTPLAAADPSGAVARSPAAPVVFSGAPSTLGIPGVASLQVPGVGVKPVTSVAYAAQQVRRQ
eukprot:TRINITY_DN37040_c0_g1_i1.p1 TRINITY_DN37040_c0_g1~~TRINITY_DN37040_c0_g1_i1.p1  ORF type:complete len:809 (-),score=159.62 TRINITY_DN37040_c0_g1_i1:137-2527(-)